VKSLEVFVVALVISASSPAADSLWLSALPAPVQADVRERPVPTFQNGFIVSYNQTVGDVWLFDKNGARTNNVRLAIPDASVMRVNDAAAAPDGRIAILATAATADGKAAPFIAWLNAAGGVDKVMRTTPFVPSWISFTQDGTLWAVGHLYNEQHTKDVPPHDVLWRFSGDGNLLQTFLPSTSFSATWPSTQSRLTASGNTVAIYFEKTREWVEIDGSSGKVSGRWIVSVPPKGTVQAIALTSSSTAILDVGLEDQNKVFKSNFFRLDRPSGKLTALDASKLGPYTILLGADADKLVMMGSEGGTFQFAIADLK